MTFKRGDTGEIDLHLADEAPRIGQGIRRVRFKVGNRHVTIKHRVTGRKAKLTRELFAQLARKGNTPCT